MKEEFKAILDRYKAGTATEEDKAFLESWYMQYDEQGEKTYSQTEQIIDAQAIWNDLQPVQAQIRRINPWPRIAAAASVILCLSVGGYFILHKKENPQFAAISAKNDIPPAGNKAILTLGHGKSIALTDVKNGQLAQQHGAIISKIADGEIAYHDQPGVKAASVIYDTLATPRGGHFQLVLADGTKAWLNAATTIRYPETFSGTERKIELIKGEAYFEVIHDSSKPFKVITHNQVIEDIGTHFNVSAYDDDPAVETTLTEGSVKVSDNTQNVILEPGQQSSVRGNNAPIIVKKANLDKTMAWKNNHFVFNGEGIENIMHEISRWYDVDVSYEGNMSGKEFVGSVSRSENISEVLRKLEETGTLHFSIEGRKIIVKP